MSIMRLRFVLALCFALAGTVMINALSIGTQRLAVLVNSDGDSAERAAGVGPTPPKDIAAVIEASALGMEPAALDPGRPVAQAFGIAADDQALAKPFSDAGRLKAIRRQLRDLGYKPGTADGIADLETRAEILAYEHDSGLALTGEPSELLLKRMVLGGSADRADGIVKTDHALAWRIVELVGKRLKALGFAQGIAKPKPARDIPQDLALSIAAFEASASMERTGRISAPLLRQLAKALTRTVAAE